MAEVKFYLEKRRDKNSGELISKNVPVLLSYSFNGQRLKTSTGIRIDAHKWDVKSQRVKRNFSETASINRELDLLKAKAINIHERAKSTEVNLSVREFNEKLFPEAAKPSVINDFKTGFSNYISSATHSKAPSTLKSIKSTYSILNDFSSKTGFKLEFESIDMAFYDKFLRYCFEERNFRNNYVGKLIKDVKSFMNYSSEEGYTNNTAYRNKKFKKLTEEPEIIFLTYEELIQFYKFKFENPRYEQVRDIFCFGCFTGLRFSDIKILGPQQIHGDQIIYRVVKTGENNTIPMNPYSKALIEKYKGNTLCFPVPSEVKTNLYLKEAAFLAGLNRDIQISHFQGVKRITETFPLHKAVTFHVSKKTFMTNFLAKGGSLHTAMAITGNKDMKSARRYFKVVDTLKAQEMSKVFG